MLNIIQLVAELSDYKALALRPSFLSLCFSSRNAEVHPCDDQLDEAGSSKTPVLIINMGKWSIPEKGFDLLKVTY